MKVEIEVSDVAIEDAMRKANSAISYWGTLIRIDERTWTVQPHGRAEFRVPAVPLNTVAGMRAMLERGNSKNTCCWSRAECDQFVQFCAYGEIRHG